MIFDNELYTTFTGEVGACATDGTYGYVIEYTGSTPIVAYLHAVDLSDMSKIYRMDIYADLNYSLKAESGYIMLTMAEGSLVSYSLLTFNGSTFTHIDSASLVGSDFVYSSYTQFVCVRGSYWYFTCDNVIYKQAIGSYSKAANYTLPSGYFTDGCLFGDYLFMSTGASRTVTDSLRAFEFDGSGDVSLVDTLSLSGYYLYEHATNWFMRPYEFLLYSSNLHIGSFNGSTLSIDKEIPDSGAYHYGTIDAISNNILYTISSVDAYYWYAVRVKSGRVIVLDKYYTNLTETASAVSGKSIVLSTVGADNRFTSFTRANTGSRFSADIII